MSNISRRGDQLERMYLKYGQVIPFNTDDWTETLLFLIQNPHLAHGSLVEDSQLKPIMVDSFSHNTDLSSLTEEFIYRQDYVSRIAILRQKVQIYLDFICSDIKTGFAATPLIDPYFWVFLELFGEFCVRSADCEQSLSPERARFLRELVIDLPCAVVFDSKYQLIWNEFMFLYSDLLPNRSFYCSIL